MQDNFPISAYAGFDWANGLAEFRVIAIGPLSLDMHLTIHISDAAYIDKLSSDNIIFELVPKYTLDENMNLQHKTSWLSSPCVRQSDMLYILHQHLQRKHPHFLLPRFPMSSRRAPGWGTEGHLQLMRRRLERYFHRLLGRPTLQEDVALHDFMTSKGEQEDQRAGIWSSFERWFKGHGSREIATKPLDDRIVVYQPIHTELPDEIKMQELLDKSLILRKNSLQSVYRAVNGAIQAVQRYSESLGRISKCIHEVTSSHVRHLVVDEDRRAGNLQDDIKATERRFRELGDRFVDLINQLQPGLGELHSTAAATVMEVIDEQKNELGHVRAYVNREILALKRYDQAKGKRLEIETKLSTLNDNPNLLARYNANLNAAKSEEETLKLEFEEKSKHLRMEMELFWQETSHEFFASIKQTIHSSLNVGQVHADALRAWFPPPTAPDNI